MKRVFQIAFLLALFSMMVSAQKKCAETSEKASEQKPEEKTELTSQLKSVQIGDILSQPEKFLGKTVIIEGEFMGWSGAQSGPPITRSDWVVKDATGAIYVYGPFPPECAPPSKGIGKKVKIKGVVRKNTKGQVYIDAFSGLRGKPR